MNNNIYVYKYRGYTLKLPPEPIRPDGPILPMIHVKRDLGAPLSINVSVEELEANYNDEFIENVVKPKMKEAVDSYYTYLDQFK